MTEPGKVRVLQVIPSLAHGGAERITVDLVRSLDSSRIEVALCILERTVPGDLSGDLVGSGVSVILLGAGRGPKPKVIRELIHLTRSFHPDVVHTHLNALKYAWIAASAERLPVVHTMHALPGREPAVDRIANRVLFWAHNITWVTVSNTAYRMLLSSPGIPRSKARLILNGIDVSRFGGPRRKNELRRRYSYPADAHIMISVGGLRAEKGYRTLVDAAAGAIREIPDVLLLICGEGPERSALERDVAARGLGDKILFLGARNDVPELLCLSDLFVSSSTQESFGLAILEALASGLPVLATAVGAVPELIGDTGTAVLVPAGDKDLLSEAIVRLLRSPARMDQMATSAWARAAEFDIRRSAAAYESIYQELARGPGK